MGMRSICSALVLGLTALSMVLEARAAPPPLWPASSLEKAESCLWNLVAEKMRVQLPKKEGLPKMRFEGPTTLEDMQDVAEVAWGMRPDTFINFYDPGSNQIFLMTKADYYQATKRSPFDSLVHEMVHAVQVLVEGADIHDGYADSYENEAVSIQTWFRESYGKNISGWEFSCPVPAGALLM